MNKTPLIIKREYLTRVRKKSFIVMSLLGPLLFAAFMVVPALLATLKDTDMKKVAVIDGSNVFTSYATGQPAFVVPDREYLEFVILEDTGVETLRENFESTGYYALLYIPENIFASEAAVLYSNKTIDLDTKSYIENSMETEMEDLKLASHDIENLDEILAEIQTNLNMRSIKWTKTGEAQESSTGLVMAVGYASGFLIYFFIFLFGAQVMRGVMEEKTNRIVEVIVSSVKPFQLMMGKIIGVGLTGLTQFIIWVVFTFVLVTAAQSLIFPDLAGKMAENPTASTQLFTEGAPGAAAAAQQQAQLSEGEEIMMKVMNSMESLQPLKILAWFTFFFLFGYLLYASMFAIVGAAVDNETDTQQFMLPITLPLVLAIFVMINAINSPDSPVAFWFSLIPFTAPVVMMVRLAFDVPTWELILSAVLLILTWLGMVWVAGKIYRTGILMYGKKVNYKELWKWLRYNN